MSEEKYSFQEIKEALYRLDWIKIMQEAVETRPSSWGVKKGEEYKAVNEWRNASDTLTKPVNDKLKEKLKGEASK